MMLVCWVVKKDVKPFSAYIDPGSEGGGGGVCGGSKTQVVYGWGEGGGGQLDPPQDSAARRPSVCSSCQPVINLKAVD